MSKGQGKLLTKHKSRYVNKTKIKVCFLRSLPWLVNRNLWLKIIFLSQYCVPKCLLRITIGNSPPSEPKPYKANFYYTGIFTYFTGIEISIPVFSITIPQVSISIPALICYENLKIKTIILKDKFLTWLGFELKTAWKKHLFMP